MATANGYGPQLDYSQWSTWPVVMAPDGTEYRKVPGTGLLYSPFMSAAKGRPVLFADPTAKAAEVQKAKDQQEALIKQEEFNRSPTGQLLPVGASIAGAIGANELFKAGIGNAPATVSSVLPNGSIVFSDGTIKTATGEILNAGAKEAASQSFANAASQGASGVTGATVSNIPAAPTGVQVGQPTPTGAEGGGSFFTTPGSESTLGTAASALAVAKGGYDTYKSVSGGEGGKGLQTGLGEIGAGIGGYTFGPAGAIVGAGMGSTLGYGIKNRDKAKGQLALLATSPLALGAHYAGKAFGFDPLGALTHESTRFKTAQNTQKLLEASDDPTYQNYVQGMREQYKEAPKGPAYAGKYNTFSEYKQAGLDANDLTGVYGNIKAFGPEWANMSQEQRVAVTKGIIDAGLYDSKKGDVIIKDENKAREIKDQVLTGFNIGTQSLQAQAAAQGAMAVPRPISKNFKR